MASSDSDGLECTNCKLFIGKMDSTEHPWLYGLVCINCYEYCKTTIANWACTPDAFQCEGCSAEEFITIFNNRFLCRECYKKNGFTTIPKIRIDWKERVLNLQLEMGTDVEKKRPIRVLSLFDGIGTGLLALEQLGLEVEAYFSCEIDNAALAVLDFRFHGRIKQLGSVTNLSIDKLKSLGHIDLLIGGSPCNQLSLANPRRKGLYDPHDTGVLFFDFVKVLRTLQASSCKTGKCFFWLFENVAAMPIAFKDTISKFLGCKPAKWDSIAFLPVQRERLFWGNIPNLHSQQVPEKPPVSLNDLLEPYRRAAVTVLGTLTTTYHSQCSGHSKEQLPVMEDGQEDGLLITERERLFGFPEHFTDGPDLSINQRQILLGRSWSVPVIKSIFLPLTKIYKIKD